MKKPEKAIEQYLKALELDEKNVFFINTLGNLYFNAKNYEKAEQ